MRDYCTECASKPKLELLVGEISRVNTRFIADHLLVFDAQNYTAGDEL
jgi:hypothetical protein